jgi:hypothetical protein
MDYKWKTSNVADTDILIPDKLNMFFVRFEDNTVPPTWPATKDWGLSFSVADVSKTFKRVNPRKVCLRTYSISPYPSLLSPHA